jgi:GNAT superfamily N-acetyltransferase
MMEAEQIKQIEVGKLLERIQPGEAGNLSVLCREIYVQYYLHLWHDNGVWYQQMRYGSAVLAEELTDPQSEFYWIKAEGRPVGYLKINLNTHPDSATFPAPGTNGLEIERIYLHKAYAGQGLGQRAMAWAEARARKLGRDFLFLYTMDSSEARFFYEKVGYVKRGDKRLSFEKMKPEYRGMYLMIKELR